MLDPALASEQGANNFMPEAADVARIVSDLVNRAYQVSEREDVRTETEQQLKNLVGEWHRLTQPPGPRPLVYTGRGLKAADMSKTVLMRPMELEVGRGAWRVANSMREVEPEIPVIVIDEDQP
jgi:acyl-CoA synthetase (NDP forming)